MTMPSLEFCDILVRGDSSLEGLPGLVEGKSCG